MKPLFGTMIEGDDCFQSNGDRCREEGAIVGCCLALSKGIVRRSGRG
jgi:hypothetical protein